VASERYTPIGCGLWTWKPWIDRGSDARLLWLALYTSSGAKRSVPGLWPGTLHGMADDCRLSLNQTYNALDELIGAKLVDFDSEQRLARLTCLPDTHDRAHNGQALSGWWTRFCSLPKCTLRDAHVGLLWTLVSAGRPDFTGKTDEQKLKLQKGWDSMIGTWRRTFGTIDIPKQLPASSKLSSSDTGTVVQPSLFAPKQILGPDLGSSDFKYSDPPAMDQPTMAHGPDQDQDLDLPESGGEGGSGGEGATPDGGPTNLVPGPWRLQLVPAEPEPDPTTGTSEAQNEYRREMKRAIAEAAATSGIGWIVPQEDS